MNGVTIEANSALGVALFDKQHAETDHDHQQHRFRDLEGDDLRRDRGADIGPHNLAVHEKMHPDTGCVTQHQHRSPLEVAHKRVLPA